MRSPSPLLVAAALLAGLAACTGPSPASSPAPSPGTATATSPTGPPTSSGSASPAVTPTLTPSRTPTADAFTLLPLYPFASRADAAAWQQQHRRDGSDAWHLDARTTAVRFARDYLGFREITRATSYRGSAADAHVGVGAPGEGGSGTTTAAVVHLQRVGTGADAPWEVVGTDDTRLTLDRPRYGASVSSPVTMGGVITGVDESLHVQVRALSSTLPLGDTCCTPAGGQATPWRVTTTYRWSGDRLLTLVVWTGGHLLEVEQFAVTGVRPA